MARRGRLSVKLGAIFGLIVFISLAVSYLYQGRQLREFFIRGVRADLLRELRLNSGMLDERPAEWRDATVADRWANRVGAALAVRVTMVGLDGKVIGDSYVPPEMIPFMQDHSGRTEVREAMLKGVGESIRYSETVHEEMLYLAVPVGSPKRWGVLRFAKPLHDIHMLEGELRQGILGGLLWALLISFAAGTLSAYLLSRPLESIAEAADRFLRGQTEVRVPARRSDEIGRLSMAFNYMADEIVRMNRQEEWLREVLSSIREAIVVTSADGQVVLVNPAASRLFPVEWVMNRPIPVRKIADKAMRELLERVQASSDRLYRDEMTLMTSKGERVLTVSAVAVMQGDRYDGTVVVINDITRLRNLERMRRDFVSSVSHELRTPLASIRGYTETLLEGAMNDPDHATAFLRIILQESEQLSALVDDVLDLSKIESGKIVYTFLPLDVKPQIEKTVAMFDQAASKKGVRIELAVPGGLPPVMADAGYFDIVMRNLVDNAVKYVEEKNGVVRVRAFAGENTVSIEVEDNGIGIPPGDLDRIFERFYRVDRARSRQLGGTGLGLAIVKHIVLAHKGDIRVRSRVNSGSVFTVTLPVQPRQRES